MCVSFFENKKMPLWFLLRLPYEISFFYAYKISEWEKEDKISAVMMPLADNVFVLKIRSEIKKLTQFSSFILFESLRDSQRDMTRVASLQMMMINVTPKYYSCTCMCVHCAPFFLLYFIIHYHERQSSHHNSHS